MLLLEDDSNNNTKKDEPITLDNERYHTKMEDSFIFQEATYMDAHENGVMGIDQVESLNPEEKVSVSLLGAHRSVPTNLEDISNMWNNWGSPPELRQRTLNDSLNVKANSCMKCTTENEITEDQKSNGAASSSCGLEQQQQPDKDSNKGRVSFGDP